MQRAPLAGPGGRLDLRVFVDRSSSEVFGGHGGVALKSQIFPGGASFAPWRVEPQQPLGALLPRSTRR